MKNHEKEDYSCKTAECLFQRKKLVSLYKIKEEFSNASVDYLEEIIGKPENPRTKFLDVEGKEHIEWEWEKLPIGYEKIDSNGLCTFTKTVTKGVEQKWYKCYTCMKDDEGLICEICIKNCHAGHRTVLNKFKLEGFCKCDEQASNCKMLKHEEPICPPSSPPLIHQDLEHERIETSDLPTQNSNSNDIPIFNELIIAYSGLNIETPPNQELIEMADNNKFESQNEKETKICDECEEGEASYHCLECEDSLCEGCYNHHLKKKKTKNHTLILIRNLKLTKLNLN